MTFADVAPPGVGPETLVREFTDFTGGLNLISQNYKLRPNESSDMANVDISERGGVSRRRGWTDKLTVAAAGHSRGKYGKAQDETVNHVVYLDDDDDTAYYWDGGTSSTQLTLAGVVQAGVVGSDTDWTENNIDWATFENITYGARGDRTAGARVTISYDPSGVDASTANSVSAMTDPAPSGGPTAWDVDYDSPSGTKFPRCRFVAAHQSMMWAAYTTETDGGGETDHPSRVRWSHPGDAGSWRENDYIDVDPGVDGDAITGIVPFRDHLVVFKSRGAWAIFGYSPDTFQVIRIADDVGAVARGAVAATEHGVFFYDEFEGVYLWDGQKATWLFEKIEPALRDGSIKDGDKTVLGLLDHRLWVAVRWTDASNSLAGRVFIWDPIFNGWTSYTGFSPSSTQDPNNHVRNVFMYDAKDGNGELPYVELAHNNGADISSICQVDVNGVHEDTIQGATEDVNAHYLTPWIDMEDPARDKRWRRPEFIMSGGYSQTTVVEIYRDWNLSAAAKSLTLTTTAAAGDAQWDVDDWDVGFWALDADLLDVVIRGGSIGAAGRSLAFNFIPPDDGNRWDLHAFMITYRNKRLKG